MFGAPPAQRQIEARAGPGVMRRPKDRTDHRMNEAPNGTARDPVCGMVDPARAAGRFDHFDHEDRTCFCCAGYLTKFRGDVASPTAKIT